MEIIILVARIVLLIAGGMSALDAVMKTSDGSGVDFGTLWDNLPGQWK